MAGFARDPYVPQPGSGGWIEEEEEDIREIPDYEPADYEPADHADNAEDDPEIPDYEPADYEPVEHADDEEEPEEETEPEEGSEDEMDAEDLGAHEPEYDYDLVEEPDEGPAEEAPAGEDAMMVGEPAHVDDEESDAEVDIGFDEAFDEAMLEGLVDESESDRDGDSEVDDPMIINGRPLGGNAGREVESPPRWAQHIHQWSRDMGRRPPFDMQRGYYHIDDGSSADRSLPVVVGRIARHDHSLSTVRDTVRDLGLETRQLALFTHQLSAEQHGLVHEIQTLRDDLVQAQAQTQALRDELAASRATVAGLRDDVIEAQGAIQMLQETADEHQIRADLVEQRAEAAEEQMELHAQALHELSERMDRIDGM